MWVLHMVLAHMAQVVVLLPVYWYASSSVPVVSRDVPLVLPNPARKSDVTDHAAGYSKVNREQS